MSAFFPPSNTLEQAIDFSECEGEPIRMLGLAQAHGILFAVNRDNGRIEYVSESVETFFAQAVGDVLQRPWAEIAARIGLPCGEWPTTEFGQPDQLTFAQDGRTFFVSHYRNGDLDVWELENAHHLGETTTGASEIRFPEVSNVFLAARQIVRAIALLTGYDRVMAYRFHPDWSGEVVAEHRRPDLVSYLGLRYPATDIPAQARQLYRENPMRSLVDVNALPTPILSANGSGPLDLSRSVLRSMSPYHIEYLQNMGVGATMTISVLVEGELWGLIACHHDKARLTHPALRRSSEELAAALGVWITERQHEERDRRRRRQDEEEIRLRGLLEDRNGGECLRQLLFGAERLCALVEADAAAILIGTAVISVGPAPQPDWIRQYAQELLTQAGIGAVQSFDRLPLVASGGLEPGGEACGMAVCVVASEPEPMVFFCFRGEMIREVHWGGDPARPVEIDAHQRMSPRRSFALWRETVRGASQEWTPENEGRLRALAALVAERLVDPGFRAEMCADIPELVAEGGEGALAGVQLTDSLSEGLALFIQTPDTSEPVVLTTNTGFNEFFVLDALDVIGVTFTDFLRNLGWSELAFCSNRQRVEAWSPGRGHCMLVVGQRDALRVCAETGSLRVTVLDFVDVTAEQRMSDAMQTAREQALQASGMKTALLANMSHELRTPLNAILGFSELMANETFGPLGAPEYREFSHDVHRAGEHLLGLVDDILDLAKLEAGTDALNRSEIDLAEVIREVATWFRPMADSAAITLELNVPERPVEYYGDARRLRQVAVNLLTNAVKFTPAGGQVICRLSYRSDRAVVFEVVDTGRGIAGGDLNRVFDRFFQVDASDSRSHKGAGLGLAIVRSLVELHGGRVEIQSAEGKGTCVRVTLPEVLAPDARRPVEAARGG